MIWSGSNSCTVSSVRQQGGRSRMARSHEGRALGYGKQKHRTCRCRFSCARSRQRSHRLMQGQDAQPGSGTLVLPLGWAQAGHVCMYAYMVMQSVVTGATDMHGHNARSSCQLTACSRPQMHCAKRTTMQKQYHTVLGCGSCLSVF